MLNFRSSHPYRPYRRWIYPLLSSLVAVGIISTSLPSQAISIGDLIRGGIQVIQGIQISNMSDEQEVSFGKDIDKQLKSKEIRVSRNKELTVYINDIGQRLAAVSERPNIPYTFQVVEDKNINAFATVGGFVYIHTGLIEAAENESELASVIAHEIGHITERHVLRNVRKAAIESGVASAAGVDRSTAVGLGVEVALRLPRSRSYEFEADNTGLQTLIKAGYAPSGMVTFFEKLLEKGGSRPAFLSTHPNTEDRIQAIRQQIDPAIANQGKGLDKEAYKSQLSRLMR